MARTALLALQAKNSVSGHRLEASLPHGHGCSVALTRAPDGPQRVARRPVGPVGLDEFRCPLKDIWTTRVSRCWSAVRRTTSFWVLEMTSISEVRLVS